MSEQQDYCGEKRTIIVKLSYNKRQLLKAIEEDNEDKIHGLKENIKLYECELKKFN